MDLKHLLTFGTSLAGQSSLWNFITKDNIWTRTITKKHLPPNSIMSWIMKENKNSKMV